MVTASLDLDLAPARRGARAMTDLAHDADSFVVNEFPVLTHSQPVEWWEQVMRAAEQLTEAMRTGRDLAPRTPAQEVVLCMAAEQGWPDMVLDDLNVDNDGNEDFSAALRAQFDALAEQDGDFAWDEVVPALTGDTDVEKLWLHEFDGIGDPSNEINQELGIGDYRPQSWHSTFEPHDGEQQAHNE